jgi:hypothetical protein
MHTEHLQRVRLSIVTAGWLVAIAVTSLIVVVLLGLNVLVAESTAGTRASMGAVAVGFFVGGLFAGLRAGEAPILHGAALGLLSLIVWFVLNFLSAILFKDFGWQALTPELAVTLVLIQIVAAILGARFGYRAIKKGRA